MNDRDAYETLQVSPHAHESVIRAAYRALAALYHPDGNGSEASQRRMSELNAAFALVRTPALREAYDRTHKRQAPAQTPGGQPAGTPAKRDVQTLDFGRYQGWTVSQLARHDPDYLRWLSRHSSGIRYRTHIEAALRESPPAAATTHTRRR